MEKGRFQAVFRSSKEVCEEMSKLLTLRGNFALTDNQWTLDHRVFVYEAGDLTRGWEIESAYVWPRTVRGEIGTSDGIMEIVATLMTDTGVKIAGAHRTGDLSNAADNRQCGWAMQGYQIRAAGTDEDFLANTGIHMPAPFLLDPNQIVQQGLYLNALCSSDSGTEVERLWNYLIILKPKKMTPIQSILHMVKNRGQDIEN